MIRGICYKWEKEREKEEGFLKYVNAYILFGQTIEQRIEIKIIDKRKQENIMISQLYRN